MTHFTARLLRILICLAVTALLLGGYLLHYAEGGLIPCPLLLLTGWECPVCGMTRAAAALLQGNVATAFARNALWPLYTLYLLWVAVSDGIHYLRRGELRLLPSPRWLHPIMLALTLGYGVLRNLL